MFGARSVTASICIPIKFGVERGSLSMTAPHWGLIKANRVQMTITFPGASGDDLVGLVAAVVRLQMLKRPVILLRLTPSSRGALLTTTPASYKTGQDRRRVSIGCNFE